MQLSFRISLVRLKFCSFVYSQNKDLVAFWSKDFKLRWRDDFDSFDPGRWFKQSGTFDENSSVFHSANVYTEGGNLVLKMEKDKYSHHKALHHPETHKHDYQEIVPH